MVGVEAEVEEFEYHTRAIRSCLTNRQRSRNSLSKYVASETSCVVLARLFRVADSSMI